MSAQDEREAALAASPDLEVLWQRHLPAESSASADEGGPAGRAAVLARLSVELSRELYRLAPEVLLGGSDLVVTISRRPVASDGPPPVSPLPALSTPPEPPRPYRVLLAINEPDVAVTVRYDVRAADEREAIRTAVELATERFGAAAWHVERVEDGR